MATQNNTSSKPSLRGGTTKQSHEATTNQSHDATVNNKQIVLAKKPRNDVPKLRFKGYEEKWELKSLREITKINQGLQIAIAERFTKEGEGLHFYITNEFLRKGSTKKYFIKNPTESVLCNEDDILMTRTGNTGQVVTGVKGAFHNNFFKIKFDSDCDKWFLYYFLTDYRTQHTILKLAGTSTIPDLNHGDFYRLKINLPKLPEQQKIASFLTAVDTKLQQLTTKKEKLSQYKKGAMQQLFSQQLRFKPDVIARNEAISQNETEFPDWEEKKLKDFVKINQGLQIAISERYTKPVENGYFYITNEFLRKKSEKQYFIKNPPNSVICNKDDILMTRTGNTGQVVTGVEGAFHNNFFKIKFDSSCYKDFLFYFLTSVKTQHIIMSLAGTSTIPDLNHGDFYKIEIRLPSLKEQQKIANYLSAIDTKIATVQTQISNTKQFKKGLLQQMFV
jgi:type I restriction enzyme S subunit